MIAPWRLLDAHHQTLSQESRSADAAAPALLPQRKKAGCPCGWPDEVPVATTARRAFKKVRSSELAPVLGEQRVRGAAWFEAGSIMCTRRGVGWVLEGYAEERTKGSVLFRFVASVVKMENAQGGTASLHTRGRNCWHLLRGRCWSRRALPIPSEVASPRVAFRRGGMLAREAARREKPRCAFRARGGLALGCYQRFARR